MPRQTVASEWRLWLLISLVTLAWLAWVVLMTAHPSLGEPLLRAAARVSIVLAPAIAYVLLVERARPLTALGFDTCPFASALLGVGAFAVFPGLLWCLRLLDGATPAMPSAASAWLNFIVGSPLAEECLYRGLLFRQLRQRHTFAFAATSSAAAFLLLHLPVWLLLDGRGGFQPGLSAAQVLAYGLLFAWLYAVRGSIWAPLLFHALNNFACLAFE